MARFAGARCCVTGGAGFIGGHLAEALLGLGASVVILDDLSTGSARTAWSLVERAPESARFVQGSILDDDALGAAVELCQYVFHAAALASVPRSIEDPERTWAVNATGTLRVLRAAQRAGVRRVVYSASSSAYGNAPGLPKREEMTPAPLSPYGASKLAGEHLGAAFAESYGLSVVSLRYFNVFGPRQPAGTAYAGVIPSFAARVLSGRAPRVEGDGHNTRDFTHVDNAVRANLLAAGSERPLAGEVYNVATGSRRSILELAGLVIRELGPGDGSMRPEHGPARPGDVFHSHADITAARRELGYEPAVGFEEGLVRTLAWYRERHRAEGVRGSAEGALP